MRKENLTRIKHIGSARLKILKKNGIAKIVQLHQIPVEKLAGIQSFGKHNAVRIKKEVADYIAKHPTNRSKKMDSTKSNIPPEDQKLRKYLKRLSKRLIRADEKLKPLWKKKYLAPYIDFKKSAKKLNQRIKAIGKKKGPFSPKEKDQIIKKVNALTRLLDKDGKKPKMKGFKKITTEIKSLSKFLKVYKS